MPSPSDGWWRQEARHWQAAGRVWTRWEPQLLASLGTVDPKLLRALDARPGQRALDVGCGLGEPALAVASLVGAKGFVLGIDLSPLMIETARRRARARRATNARFRVADAQRFRWRGRAFDRIVSRYGIMFPEDSLATLENLHSMLRPGGRAAFAVWGPTRRNPFFTLRADAVRPFQKGGSIPAPDGPGPMRFARPGSLPALLRRAGFRDIRREGVAVAHTQASPEEFAQFVSQTSMERFAGSLTRADRVRLKRRLERAARTYFDGQAVRIPAFAWVISARR